MPQETSRTEAIPGQVSLENAMQDLERELLQQQVHTMDSERLEEEMLNAYDKFDAFGDRPIERFNLREFSGEQLCIVLYLLKEWYGLFQAPRGSIDVSHTQPQTSRLHTPRGKAILQKLSHMGITIEE